MNPNGDPVGERLRSYYQSIQGDAPARLEARVSRALDSAPAARPVHASWRPLFGLAAVGAAVVIVALVARGLVPAPTASPSGAVGATSASPSPTAELSSRPTPIIIWVTPTPVVTPSPIIETPSPRPTATPTPHVSGLSSTGSMTLTMIRTTATLLADGRVLFAGGLSAGTGNTATPPPLLHRVAFAEIYDPSSGEFTQTGSMAESRFEHTATRLRDGRVLVVGGADQNDGIDNLATAELYDPVGGKFTLTGSLAQGRALHTATLLDDGRVLIAGGYGGGTSPLASAEIYDPATGKFTATGSMTVARQGHTATLLPDGRVLIAGGNSLAPAELYDPATGKFTATGSMAGERDSHAAALLPAGRVLIFGGYSSGKPIASAEIYDPATGKFTATGSIAVAGSPLGASLVDGRVLVVVDSGLYVYDRASGKFKASGKTTYTADTATLLTDGRVLITEGSPAQLYQP